MTFDDLAPLSARASAFFSRIDRMETATMLEWRVLCRARCSLPRRPVNTTKRMHCDRRGAASIDGSSASRYSVNLPKLSCASRHRDLFAPRAAAAARYAGIACRAYSRPAAGQARPARAARPGEAF